MKIWDQNFLLKNIGTKGDKMVYTIYMYKLYTQL